MAKFKRAGKSERKRRLVFEIIYCETRQTSGSLLFETRMSASAERKPQGFSFQNVRSPGR